MGIQQLSRDGLERIRALPNQQGQSRLGEAGGLATVYWIAIPRRRHHVWRKVAPRRFDVDQFGIARAEGAQLVTNRAGIT